MKKLSLGTLALALVLVSVSGCKAPGSGEKPSPEGVKSAPKPPSPASPKVAETPPAEAALPSRPKEKLNVIFLTVDALRADMPWVGYPKAIAPNLTKLAAEGVVYENHRSTSSYTAQTVATFLSGRYASTLYRTGMFFTNYAADNHFIPEIMQAAGVRTLAVHAHLYFDRAPGLKQGFDEWKMVPGLTWNSETDESVTSPKSIDAMTALLQDKKNTDGQFFLWAHLMDPHDKYVKHEEAPDFGDKNRGRYDSEVWFVDHHLGKFLEFARAEPWWAKTALVISADHGESFGEHKMFKHAFELWEDLARVPLIVVAPGARARHIPAARTHVDLAPTILDLMGLSPDPGMQGRTLVPEIYGAPAESREPILLELAEDTNNAHRQAILVDPYKLILFETGKAGRDARSFEREEGESCRTLGPLEGRIRQASPSSTVWRSQAEEWKVSQRSKRNQVRPCGRRQMRLPE
jgi:choline-sulfatase